MLKDFPVSELDAVINYLYAHGVRNTSLASINKAVFHNSKKSAYVSKMLEDLVKETDGIITSVEFPIGMTAITHYSAGPLIEEFFMKGGFKSQVEQAKEKYLREQHRLNVQHQANESSVIASQAAVDSAKWAKIAGMITLFSLIIAAVAWLFPRTDSKLEERIDRLEKQISDTTQR